MSEVPGLSPDGSVRGPHGIGDEWLSFELRMRKRRLAKCLLRADLALEDGNVEDARAALDEASQLEPASTEAAVLRERLNVMQSPSAVLALTPHRSRRIRIAYGSGLLLLAAAGVTFGVRDWTSAQAPPAVTTAAAVEPDAATSTGIPGPKPDSARLLIVQESVTVPEAAPRIIEDPARLPVPGPPIADAEPQSQPVVRAANRFTAAAPPPVTPEVRSELPIEALPERSVTPPPIRAAEPPPPEPDPIAPNTSPRAESSPVPAEAAAASPPRDESIVRAVLQRYEVAYSRLDATAASIVWPGVNKGALARAFEGLASQHVSLGSCDVAVNGPAARATCSGSATWEPKIGGGVRTEARQWNFELRKKGSAWQIERAIAARLDSDFH